MSNACITVPQPWPAPPPPSAVSLENREVHVWCAQLDLPARQVERLRRYLADDELEKAGRFLF